ncbi:MAG: ACP S-malonyltransferase [Saprospiraceae bacterium]|nr:ACP S-malonyltransferase [Saprospiraceae bacterium]MCB0678524.1 ACP S-malonyltransferase [Saprospiraceae bacterium]MCB0680575.1 ACP S-malonyltransferase [Saprospiraceae bacterium]
MKAYVFPGQASQFEGMGKDLYESSELAASFFERANDILGFRISDIMFEGTADDLQQTRVTQPAVFLHSTVKASMAGEAFRPDAVAGHSLGEFSALVAAKALTFEDGLRLVQQRAEAMQKACELVDSTMAAIVGMEDSIIEEVCASIQEVVVPANYNCPGQLVISGTVKGIEQAVAKLQELGAKRAIVLPVSGAFHSPLMQPAKEQLERAIGQTPFAPPVCPIYQNVTARPETDPEKIQQNLIDQLTAPVRWTQTMLNMIHDGVQEFIEVGGTGKTLRGFVMKVDRSIPTDSL